MKCPFCGTPDTRVISSRPSDNDSGVRRRRECQNPGCARRFTTSEMLVKVELMVVKRDGTRTPFEIVKVRSGLIKACEKRPVTAEQIEEMAGEVERELLAQNELEISSQEIGRIVLRLLKSVDPVAYLRFASVYKQFQDLQDFNAELKDLMKH